VWLTYPWPGDRTEVERSCASCPDLTRVSIALAGFRTGSSCGSRTSLQRAEVFDVQKSGHMNNVPLLCQNAAVLLGV
jgi:hypothetical protein